jgi:tetratricopeptide (TPR) repeat protein
MNTILRIAVATVLTTTLTARPAQAGRGGGGFHGGGFGGFHGGGFGGFHGGGVGVPSFPRAPAFSMPRAMPSPGLNPAFRGGALGPRPAIGAERFGIGARPPIGARPEFGTRPNIAVNRPGNLAARNLNVNRIDNVTNFSNISGVNAAHWGRWGSPYAAYHAGWVHGYWNGHYGPGGWWSWGRPWGYGGWGYPSWGWGWGGYGLGLLGWGLAGWALGSMLYNWGYANYYNPYYGGYGGAPVVVASVPYDYTQPIDTQSTPPAHDVTDAAIATFGSARQAFLAGDYNQALRLVDQAIRQMPHDATLHEFRALVLFALGQYDQAAISLYAVLAVGPGWDWTTLISLYPNVDVYTSQLRALEQYCNANPNSAAARFVLAYHYLTQGHTSAAVDQLRQAVKLQPKDRISAELLQQLTQPAPTTATGPPAPAELGAEQPPAAPAPVKEGSLIGTWTAKPSSDTTITLTIDKDGRFTWKVADKGPPHQFIGESTYGNDLLTLAQSQGPPMVGKLTWRDENHFNFKILGAGPDDPGLDFSKD